MLFVDMVFDWLYIAWLPLPLNPNLIFILILYFSCFNIQQLYIVGSVNLDLVLAN